MISLSLQQISQVLGGQSFNLNPTQLVSAVTIDSRSVTTDYLFIAIRGERFDGHDFAALAVQQGACAVVVEQHLDGDLPQIVVADCKQALGQLAHYVRRQSQAKFVALTGSSGKTSVKEMTATILKQCGPTLYTQGNLNNDLGVPLTLLQLNGQETFAVIELGANHQGEIAYTTRLVEPQSVLINNIAAAHLAGFGSLEGVAKAKGEILQGLPPQGGCAIINLDSQSAVWQPQLAAHQCYTFAIDNPAADYYAEQIEFGHSTKFKLHTPNGEFSVELPLPGRHNIANALAATALAMSVGADQAAVQQGLASLKAVKGRLYPIQLNANSVLFDDSYNANVSSMLAAIEVLAAQSGYRILVVGDMGELGEAAIACHQQLGQAAKAAGLDCVLSVGELSQQISELSGVGRHFSSKSELIVALQQLIQQHSAVSILVKGSRSSRMEEIVAALTNERSIDDDNDKQ